MNMDKNKKENILTEGYAFICGQGVYATFRNGKFLHIGGIRITDK